MFNIIQQLARMFNGYLLAYSGLAAQVAVKHHRFRLVSGLDFRADSMHRFTQGLRCVARPTHKDKATPHNSRLAA